MYISIFHRVQFHKMPAALDLQRQRQWKEVGVEEEEVRGEGGVQEVGVVLEDQGVEVVVAEGEEGVEEEEYLPRNQNLKSQCCSVSKEK